MTIYEYNAFPNPRRVRMFLAEKGIAADYVQVNVPAGEHKAPSFLAKSASGTVPLLELDCGTCIDDSLSICRYYEEDSSAILLMGSTAKSKALVDMWLRRIDVTLMNPIGNYFHHATDGLGDEGRYRNKTWGERNLALFNSGIKNFESFLAGKQCVVNNEFSLADITALCAIDFALALNLFSLNDYPNLEAWYELVSSRPSASA